MAVVIETIAARRPRHPEKAHRPDQPVLPKPDWIRVKAPVSPGYVETQRIVRDERPAHGLRGSRLPQYRRVLGEKARHLHDHGRHLHAGLRVLQRQDRAAGRARCRRARARRRRDGQARACARRRDVRRSRRSRRRRGRALRRGDRRDPRALPEHHDRSADAGFFAQGRRGRNRGRGAARYLQSQSRNRAVEIPDGAPRRALLRLHPSVAARQGDRCRNVHQIRNHGRARRGAQRSAASDGRSARGRASTF